MSLTRKMLKAMGIEEEKIDQIIEAHVEAVDALKEQRDGYKVDAEKLPGIQKELEELKNAAPKDDFREKYESEHEAFEEYKKQVADEKLNAEKSELYKKFLTDEVMIDPKRVNAVMKVADLSGVSVKDGAIVDADKLAESVRDEWSDFVIERKTDGANTDNPPAASKNGEKEPTNLREAMKQKYGVK